MIQDEVTTQIESITLEVVDLYKFHAIDIDEMATLLNELETLNGNLYSAFAKIDEYRNKILNIGLDHNVWE
jgi:hypothetical protein